MLHECIYFWWRRHTAFMLMSFMHSILNVGLLHCLHIFYPCSYLHESPKLMCNLAACPSPSMNLKQALVAQTKRNLDLQPDTIPKMHSRCGYVLQSLRAARKACSTHRCRFFYLQDQSQLRHLWVMHLEIEPVCNANHVISESETCCLSLLACTC